MMAGFAMALLASIRAKYWGHAVLSLAAFIESYRGERHAFHVWVRDGLLGLSAPHEAKQALQAKLLNFAIVGGCIAVLLLLPYFLRASGGRRLMLVGTSLILGMLALEMISPHHIDAVIYHAEGPFYRSAIVYFAGAMAVTAGGLMQRRQSRPRAVPSA